MRVLLIKFLISTLVLNFIILCLLISFNKNLYAADKSLSFDGADDFIEIPNNSALNPTGDYTVAAWFKQEGVNAHSGNNSWQSIITSRSTDNPDAKGYMMYLQKNDNKLQYWKGTDSGNSWVQVITNEQSTCLLYTSPSPRDS